MALITGLGLIAVSILTAVLSRILAEEVGAWNPSIVRGLIKFAVGRLPEGRRERFQEEWQSHVSEVPGQIGKLLAAVGFLIAAYDVALNDRRNQVLERLVLLLAQLDDMQSTSITVVSLIQRDKTLVSLEGMGSLVNCLRSELSKSQEYRNGLATLIATVSGTPRTLVRNLPYILRGRKLAPFCMRISQGAERIEELNIRIARQLEERTRRQGR